jgi:ABC-type dipeptide/oligopeptide/nickel transport system permease subunit
MPADRRLAGAGVGIPGGGGRGRSAQLPPSPNDVLALPEVGARPAAAPARHRLPVVSLGIIGLFVLGGLLAPWVSPADPQEQSLRNRFRPPVWEEAGSWQRPLGTDRLGRDLLSRILWGSRVSLAAGVLTVLLATVVGATVGLVAGYYGGRVDVALMRVTDATRSFPAILLALILAVTVGPSFVNVVVAIAVILWARYARVIRGQVLTLMGLDFIAQARLAGAGAWRIITRHLLPNTFNTLVVLVTLQIGYVIIVEASLSFLGAGIPPPTPAWGSMIAEGREFVTSAWWVSSFPGLAILLVVLAFNLLGDWLRDTLDPKLRQL